MIKQTLLFSFVPLLISCTSEQGQSMVDTNYPERTEKKIATRTFVPSKSINSLELGNAHKYVQEMTKRKFRIAINQKFDFFEPVYEFKATWFWKWHLDSPQRKDLYYENTSYIKVGSVLYETNILPISVFQTLEKIESFPKGHVTKQKLGYRPIPWR